MATTRQVKYFIHDDDIVIEDSGDFIYIDHAADRFLLPDAARFSVGGQTSADAELKKET